MYLRDDIAKRATLPRQCPAAHGNSRDPYAGAHDRLAGEARNLTLRLYESFRQQQRSDVYGGNHMLMGFGAGFFRQQIDGEVRQIQDKRTETQAVSHVSDSYQQLCAQVSRGPAVNCRIARIVQLLMKANQRFVTRRIDVLTILASFDDLWNAIPMFAPNRFP